MLCPRCNAVVDDNMRFCGICGEDMLLYLQSQQKAAPEAACPDAENSQPVCDGGEQYSYAENRSESPVSPAPEQEDKPDTLMNVLSFFIPLAGMILYFLEREKHPIKARAMLKWTVAAYIASYAVAALSVLFCFGMMFFVMFMETAYYW